jgi:hypothetical protein
MRQALPLHQIDIVRARLGKPSERSRVLGFVSSVYTARVEGQVKTMFVVAALIVSASASAHHSYAMFDIDRTATVTGTMAKVEWANPHMTVWLYVPDPKQQSGYALYAFETGGTNMMLRMGWNKSTFPAGEKVTIDYHPLKGGRTGGAFIKATKANGATVMGDPGADLLKAEGRRRDAAAGRSK